MQFIFLMDELFSENERGLEVIFTDGFLSLLLLLASPSLPLPPYFCLRDVGLHFEKMLTVNPSIGNEHR